MVHIKLTSLAMLHGRTVLYNDLGGIHDGGDLGPILRNIF